MVKYSSFLESFSFTYKTTLNGQSHNDKVNDKALLTIIMKTIQNVMSLQKNSKECQILRVDLWKYFYFY